MANLGKNSKLFHFLTHLLKKRLMSMKGFQLFVAPKFLTLILHKTLTGDKSPYSISRDPSLERKYVFYQNV